MSTPDELLPLADHTTQARQWRRVTVALVLFGAILRIVQYLWCQSYWGDEISLLLNTSGKSLAQLFTEKLDHSQAAPPLFLAALRGLTVTCGTSEYVQRLLPLMLGIAALPLMAILAWRVLPPRGATFVVGIVCVSDRFIWHSAEAKQYSGDLMFAIVILLLALWSLQRQASLRRFAILGVVAAIAIWASHPAILLFPAISLVALACFHRDGWRRVAAYLACNVPFAVSFAFLYLFSIRIQRDDGYLQEFWADAFPDWHNPGTLPAWLLGGLQDLATYPLMPMGWLGIALIPLMIWGGIALYRRRHWIALAVILLPLAATIGAACVHAYPLSGSRIGMFLMPGLLLLCGAGVEELLNRPQVRPSWLALAAMACVLALPTALALHRAFVPRNKSHMRPVVQYLQSHRQPGQAIYIAKGVSEFRWYWPDAPEPLFWTPPQGAIPSQRFWCIFASKPNGRRSEQQDLLNTLRLKARQTDHFQVAGGAVYGFEQLSIATKEGD